MSAESKAMATSGLACISCASSGDRDCRVFVVAISLFLVHSAVSSVCCSKFIDIICSLSASSFFINSFSLARKEISFPSTTPSFITPCSNSSIASCGVNERISWAVYPKLLDNLFRISAVIMKATRATLFLFSVLLLSFV